MVDATSAALIVAGLSTVTALVSIIYTHINTRQTRRLVDASIGATALSNHAEMLNRAMHARSAALHNPKTRERLFARYPELEKIVADAGDIETFSSFRDVMENARDLYFLRKEGAITDAYWWIWGNTQPRIYSQEPAFQAAFRFAAKVHWIHPEFVAAFEPMFTGGTFADPMRTR
ncbi:MAG: hypothetical protein ACYDDF_04415 [Thermoplasmatota archaeon]